MNTDATEQRSRKIKPAFQEYLYTVRTRKGETKQIRAVGMKGVAMLLNLPEDDVVYLHKEKVR